MSEIRPALARETFSDWSGADRSASARLSPAEQQAMFDRKALHVGLLASRLDVEGAQVNTVLDIARAKVDGLVQTNGGITAREMNAIFRDARELLKHLAQPGTIGDGGVIHTQGGGSPRTDAQRGADGVLRGTAVR